MKWAEPAHKGKGGGARRVLEAEAAELRKHPGRWADLEVSFANIRASYTLADNIRRGRVAAFRGGVFEARAEGGKVYARFIRDSE